MKPVFSPGTAAVAFPPGFEIQPHVMRVEGAGRHESKNEALAQPTERASRDALYGQLRLLGQRAEIALNDVPVGDVSQPAAIFERDLVYTANLNLGR